MRTILCGDTCDVRRSGFFYFALLFLFFFWFFLLHFLVFEAMGSAMRNKADQFVEPNSAKQKEKKEFFSSLSLSLSLS